MSACWCAHACAHAQTSVHACAQAGMLQKRASVHVRACACMLHAHTCPHACMCMRNAQVGMQAPIWALSLHLHTYACMCARRHACCMHDHVCILVPATCTCMCVHACTRTHAGASARARVHAHRCMNSVNSSTSNKAGNGMRTPRLGLRKRVASRFAQQVRID